MISNVRYTRAAAPLVRSAGALYLDSTGLPTETVLGRLLAFVRGEAGLA